AWLKAKEREFRLAEVVERWQESGKRDDYLLRGEALEDAREWSRGRNDLSVTEHEYLLAGVELARQEAEARTRIAEALRKEGESLVKVAEERSRTEHERYLGDLERERRERAEDSANSQRRLVTILTAAVLSLIGVLAWTAAERWRLNNARIELSDYTARQARASRLLSVQHLGEKALLFSKTPGQGVAALVTAIQAAGEAAALDERIPSSVMAGLSAAVATPAPDPAILVHGGTIFHAEFSRDGTKVLTASADRTAKIWGAASGRPLLTLGRHRGPVRWAGFSRDDSRALTLGNDQTARLWSTASGDVLSELTGPTTGFFPVADPNFRRLVVTPRAGNVALWDPRIDRRVANLPVADTLLTAEFSHDGQHLVTSTGASNQLWNAATGARVGTLPSSETRGVRTFLFSPDDNHIFGLTTEGHASIWRVQDRHLVTSQLAQGDAIIEGARFAPDGNTLATYASDFTAALWDPIDGTQLATTAGVSHTARIRDVVFSHDSTRFVTVSDDHDARLWDAPTGKLVAAITGHKGPVRAAAFSPDDTRLVTAGNDNTARLWNPVNGARLATLEGHTRPIFLTAFSPDGFRVLTVSDDHTARVWNAAITNPIRTLRRHQGAVNKIVYSPTGHRLVSGGDERSAFLWDTTSHAVVHELSGHLGPVVDMDFAEGAHDRLVTRAAGDESIRLWEATSGAPVQTVDAHDGPVLSAAFSQGGSRLVTAGSDGQVRTWFSSNGKPTAKPACSLPVTPVRLATLSRHGDYLVVSGHEQEPPQLWNVESCALVMSLDRHQGQLLGVVFANNDKTFLTLGSEHTGHLWSTRTGMHEFVYAPNIGRLHTAAFDPDDERILLAGMR
ncbi:MAG: hypothetical protein ACPG4T_16160, partial [Nannocystaceae bacterium]